MKINKKIIGLSALSLLAASSLNTAQAADIKARAGVGISFYELEVGSGSGSVVTADNKFVTLGATAGFGEIYVDVKFDTTASGTHDFYGLDQAFVRNELAITLGYSVNESLTVFGGFKSTESTISAPTGFAIPEDIFEADGLFGGIAAGFPINDNSSISASAALALMDGSWSNNTGSIEGDTVGISFGATYNLYLDDASGLAASWTFQGYGYDMDSGLEITEAMSNLSVSYFRNF